MKNLFFAIALITTQLPQLLDASNDQKTLCKKALLSLINNKTICSVCAIHEKKKFVQKYKSNNQYQEFINNLETNENIEKKRKPAFNDSKKPCSNPTCCKLKREQDNL